MDYDKIIKYMGDVRPSSLLDMGGLMDIDVTLHLDVGVDPPGAEGREYVEAKGTITLLRDSHGFWIPFKLGAEVDDLSWVDASLLKAASDVLGIEERQDLLKEIFQRGAKLADGAKARYMEEKT